MNLLTGEEAIDLLMWIRKQPQFRHYQLTLKVEDDNSFDVFAEELAGLPITLGDAKNVCRSILAEGGAGIPSPQQIYRRCLEHVGILAPSWEDALLLIHQAMTAGTLDGLPGPVAQAVQAKGGLWSLARTENEEATFAQLRDTYRGLAQAHDRFVLEPGGLGRLAEACAFVTTQRAQEAALVNGRWAAMELGWADVPGTLELAQDALAAFRDRYGVDAVWGVEAPPQGELRDRTGDVADALAVLAGGFGGAPGQVDPAKAREFLAAERARRG